MDFIYTNLIQYITEMSELPKYLLDSEVSLLTYMFAEISDNLTFDPIHNKYINYTTEIGSLYDKYVSLSVPHQTIHIPSQLYVFGPGIDYDRIKYSVDKSLKRYRTTSCTCVAKLNFDDFRGFLDPLTTINEFQTLYFSFMQMTITTAKSQRKHSFFQSRTSRNTQDFQKLIRISKGARVSV